MIPYEKQKFNNAKEVYTLIASLFVGIDSFLKKRIIKKKIDENKKRIPTPYKGGIPPSNEILMKYHVDPHIKHRAIKGINILLFINSMICIYMQGNRSQYIYLNMSQ